MELPQNRCGKIAQLERDDKSCPAVNRSCQHMAVIGVGERQVRYERLLPGEEAIRDVQIHQATTTGKTCRRDLRPIGQNVSRPVIVDFIGLTCLEQVREGKPHEQVAQRCRIKDACVVEDD